MKRTLLFALVFVGTAWSQEVKHAPTVEQCRADQKLWMSKLEDETTAVSINFHELQGWFHQMIECRTVDTELSVRYYNTLGEIDAEEVIRLEGFLSRHRLYDQFLAEDIQGKRR